ncbi:MAG: formate dehydrogenase subunit delta [Paraglaciecola sp.]|jgi:formate dehydrogenase subunit delta
MSSSQITNLVSMLDQIANNNNYKKTDEETAKIVANHIQKFWARSMRDRMTQYAAEGGPELTNVSKLALAQLR